MKKKITILGSTGSIGRNTLDLIALNPEKYDVHALVAHSNVTRLAEQARRFNPKMVTIADSAKYEELKTALAGTNIEVTAGQGAVESTAAHPVDWVMAAIVGAAGLVPIMRAIENSKIVALANKESLVCAGSLMMQAARAHNTTILPVDSEHNAIFQVWQNHEITKITLTASGGPFRTFTHDQLASVTIEQAISHPNWSMGAKISVDSATMMNKALEVIEAHHLFDLPEQQIDVVIHPQSIIHGLVHYADGSVLAQMGMPDMRTPISFCLAWPNRMEAPMVQKLDLAQISRLDFESADPQQFPATRLVRDVLRADPAAAIIFNAANEIAVHGFLNQQISFLDIIPVVEQSLSAITTHPITCIEQVIQLDQQTRHHTQQTIKTAKAS